MRCVVVQPIHPSGLAALRAAGLGVDEAPDTALTTLAPMLATADAVITRNWGFPAAALELAPRLRVIASHGTGVDRIDLAAAARCGVRVVNTPGANAQDVAELALGLMLALARSVVPADRSVRAGDAGWRLRRQGVALGGRVLGLWGYGHVARALVPMAQGLGMRVLALSAHADPAELALHGVGAAADAADLLARADVLSLHGLPGSRPLIGPPELAAMRPGAVLINTARGALVDETALALALHRGQLAGAALDVTQQEPLPPDSPLLSCPNLILTPHLGGNTDRGMERTAVAVANAVLAALNAGSAGGR